MDIFTGFHCIHLKEAHTANMIRPKGRADAATVKKKTFPAAAAGATG